MRYLILLFCCLAFAGAFAQDCRGYYYMKSGEVEMTLYDKKNKETGLLRYTITSSSSSGANSTATFKSEMFNEKGKLISSSNGDYQCKGGVMLVDAKVAMPAEQGRSASGSVSAEQHYIEYPANMTAGQSLKDVKMKIDMASENGLNSTIDFEETDRKVLSKETVTTSAGTWECWKISCNITLKMSMGGIGIPVRLMVTEWYAPDFGVVKTENYNKNGKLMSSMAITKVQK